MKAILIMMSIASSNTVHSNKHEYYLLHTQ